MRKTFKSALAVGLISASGCSLSPEKKEVSSPLPQKTTAEKPPVTKDLGDLKLETFKPKSIDGCSLAKARNQIRRQTLNGEPFKTDLVMSQGRPMSFIVYADGFAIVRPLILRCGKKITGYAGIEKTNKNKPGRPYDFVKIADNKKDVAGLTDKKIEKFTKTAKVSSELVIYDRDDYKEYGAESATAFQTFNEEPVGSALDNIDVPKHLAPQQPGAPNLSRQ